MKYRACAITLVVAGMLLSSISFGSAQAQIMSISSSKKGWLGVEIQDVTKRLKEQENLTVSEGAYVTNVVEDSPAEDAGIKEGDVIVKVDGKTVDDGDDLTRVVQRIKPKTEVKVEVVRGSDKKTLTAKIGKTTAPEAFAYGFGNGMRTPLLPRTPMLPKIHGGHFFYSDETNGLDVQSLSKQLADYFEVPDREGMLVANVEKGSSAEKAGFKAGDILTKVDGHRIRDLDDLHDALRGVEGKDAKCDVIRKGTSVTLTWHIEPDSDGEDWDEDEDLSYQGFTPRWEHYVAPFHFKTPVPSAPKLKRFKEEMKEFKRELKDKLMDIKREIKAELFDID